MVNLISENWQALLGVLGSVIAFFGGRKLKKAEETKSTSDALTSMQATYDTWVNDLKLRYDELKDWEGKYTKLKKEFDTYKSDN